MRTALVVIDVQNYFINEKTKNLPSKIGSFIADSKFDFVLFTKFINRPNSNFFKLLNWQKCLVSPEIDLHQSVIKFADQALIFEKNSYSIFKSNRFVTFLKRNKITKLFLCGVDIDSCILASAFEGFDLGYEIKLLKRLCTSGLGEDFEIAASKIINRNIQVDFK